MVRKTNRTTRNRQTTWKRNPQNDIKNYRTLPLEATPFHECECSKGIGQSDLQDWEGGARRATTTTSATNAAATDTHHHQQPPSPPAAYHSPSTSSTRATTTTAAATTTTTTAPSHSTTTAPPQQHHSTTSQQRRPLRQLLLPGFPCLVSQRAGVPAVLPRPPGTCGACSARRTRPKAPRLTQMRPVGGPCRRAPSSIAAHTWPRRS